MTSDKDDRSLQRYYDERRDRDRVWGPTNHPPIGGPEGSYEGFILLLVLGFIGFALVTLMDMRGPALRSSGDYESYVNAMLWGCYWLPRIGLGIAVLSYFLDDERGRLILRLFRYGFLVGISYGLWWLFAEDMKWKETEEELFIGVFTLLMPAALVHGDNALRKVTLLIALCAALPIHWILMGPPTGIVSIIGGAIGSLAVLFVLAVIACFGEE